MRAISNCIGFALVMACINAVSLFAVLKLPLGWYIALMAVLFVLFILLNIWPASAKGAPFRLRIMLGGRSLILYAIAAFFGEIALYFLWVHLGIPPARLVANGILAAALLFVLLMNGLIRLLTTARQIGLLLYVLLFFLWWVPVVNLIVVLNLCARARREFVFEMSKIEENLQREQSEICKTKYPILMVHGIFFRDWQFFNYWGRIPGELRRNGAKIYFGGHQSAAPVEQSARELAARVMEIVSQETCEKVNIIAHSKGGMDARYAASMLGLSPYIASLTTINTPHLGCRFVDALLKKAPKKLVASLSKRYNSLFQKLGDKSPDFLAGVMDLTQEKNLALSKALPPLENVYCQSVMSRMKTMFSAGFPLNLGYFMIKINDRSQNDGLVTVESAKWGKCLMVEPRSKRGVSHGDMIDLFRENIKGFDVRVFYVQLVKDLKDRGY